MVQTSVAGTFGSSKGNDGQILVSSTAGVPQWANITSTGGSCTVTNGANTINIEATGGTANSYVTDSGGPVAPLAGALTVIGYYLEVCDTISAQQLVENIMGCNNLCTYPTIDIGGSSCCQN